MMWRFFQGLSRNIRGQCNGSIRSAQQTAYLEEEKDEIVHHQTNKVQTVSPNWIQNWKAKRGHVLCHQRRQSSEDEGKHWNKSHFHHTYWQKYCHDTSLFETLRWGTGFILLCKISQLYKLNSIKDRRKELSKIGYYGSFGLENRTFTNHVQKPAQSTDPQNTCEKLEADVSWAKTPPKWENDSQHTFPFYSSNVQSIEFPSQFRHDTQKDQTENSQNEEVHKVQEKDVFDEFTNEWDNICEMYEGIAYNEQGLKLAAVGKYKEAMKYWKKASKYGCAKAYFNLGLCYELGRGIPKNEQKAVEFYQKAADNGSAVAAHNLALMYLNSRCGGSKDHEASAVKLLEQAARLGLAEAQTDLGIIYTEKDEMDSAVKQFTQAAQQKDSNAQYMLGLCYENGWGVTENACRAAELYSQASRGGNLQAKYNLAYFFEHGLGGLPVDKYEALQMYESCASLGHCAAAQSANTLNEKLKTQSSIVEGFDNSIAGLHLEISKSAPALSSYLKYHMVEFGDVDLDSLTTTTTNNTLSKSPTVDNVLNLHDLEDCAQLFSDYHGDLNSKDSDCEREKSVKFILGNEDSFSEDFSESDNHIPLLGKFGNHIPVSQLKTNDPPLLRRSDSDDRFSVVSTSSDDSDFSIVFDDYYQGFQLENITSGRSANTVAQLNGIEFSNDRGGKNRYNGFDLFGDCTIDDSDDNISHHSLYGNNKMAAVI